MLKLPYSPFSVRVCPIGYRPGAEAAQRNPRKRIVPPRSQILRLAVSTVLVAYAPPRTTKLSYGHLPGPGGLLADEIL